MDRCPGWADDAARGAEAHIGKCIVIMTEFRPKIVADALQANFARHRHDLLAAEADRQYFLQRRDQFSERLLLGVLALNGAALVALIGILGGKGKVAEALGFTPTVALFSVMSFVLGIALAGFASNERENVYVNEAGAASVKAQKLSALCASGEAPLNNENHENYGTAMKLYHDAELVGHQWSAGSIRARHWSGGAWLAGISAPLIIKLGEQIPPLSGWWPF